MFKRYQYLHLHLQQKKKNECYRHSVGQATNRTNFPVNPSNEPSRAAQEPNRPLTESLEVQESLDNGRNQTTDDFPMPDSDETSVSGPELPAHMPNDDLVDEADQTDKRKLVRLLFAEYTSHS